MADRIERHLQQHGFGLWAVEIPGVAPFVGYVGLAIPRGSTPISRRASRSVGGSMRITGTVVTRPKRAQAAMELAFQSLHLREVVSFTVPENVAVAV